jgi:AbiJ N-terminal domain 4
MLTDIFADRYADRVMWTAYTETEVKLLMQCYRLVEDIFPYWDGSGKAIGSAKSNWKSIHDRLARELGLSELAPLSYAYTAVNGQFVSGIHHYDHVCKTFMTAPFPGRSADRFVKERLSFAELAFRLRGEELDKEKAERAANTGGARLADALISQARGFSNSPNGIARYYESIDSAFRQSVDELNARLQRAGAKLNYHNGFIQIASDELVEAQIEKPFWALVADPLWKNVDIDMKEAVDRRDAKGRDPAWYAARALESTIKIISEKKGWTHGKEKGASNYIDNLRSKKNGSFINEWEEKALKDFFTSVRNPFGHGPGSAEMPELSPTQIYWALETCMTWTKVLIERI